MRIATENLLADFLREIRDVTLVQRHHEDQLKAKRAIEAETAARGVDGDKEKLPDITMVAPERAAFVPEYDEESVDDTSTMPPDEKEGDIDERDLGGRFHTLCNYRQHLNLALFEAWTPGLGVKIDYAAIVEILIQQLDDQDRGLIF